MQCLDVRASFIGRHCRTWGGVWSSHSLEEKDEGDTFHESVAQEMKVRHERPSSLACSFYR